MLQSARNAAEEILMSQTKEELHAKIEWIKQCHSISVCDKEFFKNFFDLFKKRIEMERGW